MRRRSRASIRAHLFTAVACVALGAGCKAKPVVRPKVAVTLFPVYDLARRVAGPDADVVLMVPPGRSQHNFRPTPHEMDAAAGASLGVMIGLGLDSWMEGLLHDTAPSAHLLKVGDRVPTIPVRGNALGEVRASGPEGAELPLGSPDPHVWLDPVRAILITKAVAEELARVDPSNAINYRKRAADLGTALDALDKEIDARVRTWKTRTFVTFHASFDYFADRYHLQIPAVLEPFPGTSPPLKYVQAVLKIVTDDKMPAIWSEPQLDPKPARLIAGAAQIPLGVLDPVGGQADTDSYEKLLRFDVNALETALK